MIAWLRRLFGRSEVKVSLQRLESLERRDHASRAEARVALDKAERVLSNDGANRGQRALRDR